MECTDDATRTPAPAAVRVLTVAPRPNKKRSKRQLNSAAAPHDGLPSTSLMIPNLTETLSRDRYSYDVTSHGVSLTLRMNNSFSKSQQLNSNNVWERQVLSQSGIPQLLIDKTESDSKKDDKWFSSDSSTVPILSKSSRLIWSGRSSAFRPFFPR